MYRPDFTVLTRENGSSPQLTVSPTVGKHKDEMGISDVLTGEHPADVLTGPTSMPHKTQKVGEGRKSVVWGVSHAEVIRHPCLQGTVPRYCDNHNHLTKVQCTPGFLPKVLGLA